MPVFPWKLPSMPMSSDIIRTNTVHLLSSKTCSTHLLFIDMQHIVRWKHGCRDRCCNSFRRYITRRRKFGIAETLQLKPFSVNGHLNKSIVRIKSECKHDEYGSRGKIGFPALEIFGLRLNWEVREIFNWCQQQPSQVPTDIRRTNAVNEMGFLLSYSSFYHLHDGLSFSIPKYVNSSNYLLPILY